MNEQQTAILHSALAHAHLLGDSTMTAMLNTILRIEREKVVTTTDPQEIYNLNVSGKD